jgi:superfamily II DNA/RNA helicase
VLPQAKQVLAFSATYRSDLLETLHGLMRSPQHIILSTDSLTVKGLRFPLRARCCSDHDH